MAEWLYEDGIGEARAALVERGHMLEMAIEPEGEALRPGAVVGARLARAPDGRWRAALAGAVEAELEPLPVPMTDGARFRAIVVREALAEADRSKPPRVRLVDAATPLRDGPTLAMRIASSGIAVRKVAAGDGALDATGWDEAMEEAAAGVVARAEAMLRISLTPAMTLIDVDGGGPPATLAAAGARLSGEIIRRFGIAGSIGIDLPTCAARAERQASAAALDAALPPPFERTAVNGFGFLQIVRRRERASLMETIAADPIAAAARALLRRGERATGHGAATLTAASAVIECLSARPGWQASLAARIGAEVRLHARPGLAISSGYVHRSQS